MNSVDAKKMSNKVEGEISRTLIDLGLTSMQIKIFLVATSLDRPSAKDIANAAQTHRQAVYLALSELQGLGLVERIIGTPNQYKAVRLVEALDILLTKKKSWILAVQKRTKDLIKKSPTNSIRKKCPFLENFSFGLITGEERYRHAIVEWSKETLTADHVMRIDNMYFHIREKLAPELRTNRKTKYRMVLFLKNGMTIPSELLSSANNEVRISQVEFPVDVAIYNRKKAHINIVSDRSSPLQCDLSALVSDNPSFVQMIQNYFDILWKNAKVLKD
jgi:sugar-specific transcriptional regulator TrmB